MSHELNNLYEFDEFQLDAEERVLRRGDELVALPPKAFEILLLLISRHGRIISKTEMMDAVWADSFVEESNLTQNIYTLRRVLGTEKDGKNFIENIPRRGYRFVAPVRVLPKIETNGAKEISSFLPMQTFHEKAVESAPPAQISERDRATGLADKVSARRKSAFPLLMLSVGVVTVLILGFAGFRLLSGREEKKTPAPTESVNFRKLTFTGDIMFPTLAPDGNTFSFVRDGALFIQDVNNGDEIRLNVAGEKVFGILQFSPDGNSLYFRNRVGFDLAASVFQISRFGGNPKLIAENVWSGFGFTRDGKQMAFVRDYPNEAESSLIIKNLETGEERKLTTLKLPNEFLGNGHPAFSPDG